MTSTFTPFLIYLRYKNSVIWPVCFPKKLLYLQQIKSRPTPYGTGTSHNPTEDQKHRPKTSPASHKRRRGGRKWPTKEEKYSYLIFLVKWSLAFYRAQIYSPRPKEEPHRTGECFWVPSWNPPKQIFPIPSCHFSKAPPSAAGALIAEITKKEKQLANKSLDFPKHPWLMRWRILSPPRSQHSFGPIYMSGSNCL